MSNARMKTEMVMTGWLAGCGCLECILRFRWEALEKHHVSIPIATTLLYEKLYIERAIRPGIVCL